MKFDNFNQKFIIENLILITFSFNFPANETKCDRVPKHYPELGCKAVFDDGGDCPTRLEIYQILIL